MACFNRARGGLGGEIPLQGKKRVRAGGIAPTDFFSKSGDGGRDAAIIVAERVEDIKGVLRLLAVEEGAQLQSEEGPDLADTGAD